MLSVDVLLVIESLVLASPFLVLSWWQWRRRVRAEDEVTQADRQTVALKQCLATAPDGWFGWFVPLSENEEGHGLPLSSAEGAFADGDCSRRLAVLLDLFAGQAASFADVVAAFPPTVATRLVAACGRLRVQGEAFDFTVSVPVPHTISATETAGSLAGALVGGDAVTRSLRLWGLKAYADDGSAVADILWIRDVSAEQAAHHSLANESQQREREGQVFRDALDAVPMPVWVRDDDLRVTFANRAFLEAVGEDDASEDERELAPGMIGRELRTLASAARAANEPRHASVHVVMHGRRRLMDIVETPLPVPSANGGRSTVGVALDMTRLEALRTTLEQEVTSHATVLERLGTAIAIFGKDTRLQFHNTAYARLWGLEAHWLDNDRPAYGEVMEALRMKRLLPEVADYPAYKLAELGRFTSLIEPVEDLLHLPDGQTLRRVLAPHPLGGLLATYEDVSDRLALEASRNQLIAVQRETIDHLHESVAVFGADGRLQLYNPAFAEMGGWTTESLDSRPHVNDLNLRGAGEDQRSSPAWDELRSLLAANPQQRSVRHQRIERGEGVILDTIGVPLPDGGVLFTFLNISDTARVEKALRDRAQALVAADQQKSRFMSNMSYELRTPLTAIKGFSEVLADEYYGKLNSRQKEYAQSIAESAAHLVSLIDDMSDLVMLEAGLASLTVMTFDIHAALASVLAMTREMVRRKGLVLNFDCPPDIGGMSGDEGRVKQMLYNLLTNAVKYTPSGGQITLAAQREVSSPLVPISGPPAVVFTVADTGVGIAEADQADLFDRFTRFGLGQGGSGVGLALVKRFVELHKGSVELVSVVGEGTTVTLRFPL